MNHEQNRLQEVHQGKADWYKYGPYLSERQWGTVREDYSPDGNLWSYTTHDMARSKTYRWGEEGIGGLCDNQQLLCFSVALWNGLDPILKERLFGLSGPEGNHGEDVKECYYYLDNTPTHSYMKMLYKYPQQAFPYQKLVEENRRRGKHEPEFELIDTGIYDDNRYFDVFIEYAKADADDILIQITACNRGPDDATLHVLPQLWFRNTWAWGYNDTRPRLSVGPQRTIHASHKTLGNKCLFCDQEPDLLFCNNETNTQRLYGSLSGEQYVKDGINNYLIHGDHEAINPGMQGTKAAAHYVLTIPAGQEQTVRLRLADPTLKKPFASFNPMLKTRRQEADAFYQTLQGNTADDDVRRVQRQALAGMLWNKQFYYYDVARWLDGDPAYPAPSASRKTGRNSDWVHFHTASILSMPDNWEFPWFAAWDLAFHCITLTLLDPAFAKQQLTLLTDTYFMGSEGQLPAYENNFSGTNPPVHAWAAYRMYQMDQQRNEGRGDTAFLATIFHKLLINFTWWVNRKDRNDRNIFQGGFLGMDNLGVFDRNAPLPTGGYIEQADGTAWMAMYALNMMRIALELNQKNPVYEDLAVTFFEHFLSIAGAMTNLGNEGVDLWDDEDGFYYNVLRTPDKALTTLKVRSMIGLIPLFAIEVLDDTLLKQSPKFTERIDWLLTYRPQLAKLVPSWQTKGQQKRHLLALLDKDRLKKILTRMLDETEFLSDYGIRALSRCYLEHPYEFLVDGKSFGVHYTAGASDSNLFGGNSNWRGPIWFPMNFLIVESLQRFYLYYGDDLQIEYPTGSDKMLTLGAIADALTQRLDHIFLRDTKGHRAVFGDNPKLQTDPHFKDYIWFHEYFDGDTGYGLGASHQTGWTGLIAKLMKR